MMPIDRHDVGAWVVKGNGVSLPAYVSRLGARGLGPGDAVSGRTRCLGRTHRNTLIGAGDLVVSYLGGPAGAVVEIGVVCGMAGNEVAYDGVILTAPIPRGALTGDPVLAGSELIRAPQMSNPTYFTPTETRAFADLVLPGDLASSDWSTRASMWTHRNEHGTDAHGTTTIGHSGSGC